MCSRENAVSKAPPKSDQKPAPPFPTLSSNLLHKHSSDQQVTTESEGREKTQETRTDCLHFKTTAVMSPVWLGQIFLVLLMFRIVVSDTEPIGVSASNILHIQQNCMFYLLFLTGND